MDIVFFTHPSFQSHQSMPRFANMLANGMIKRGHTVDVWSPKACFHKLPFPAFIKKWLGYIDQYILFPLEIKRRKKKTKSTTLFVFTDHALGPWVPLLKNNPHVIHCHDFLAQSAALNEIAENRIGWTGKMYQKYIRNGYRQGYNFISVSKKTHEDLQRFLIDIPAIAEVVYNGLNQTYIFQEPFTARKKIAADVDIKNEEGYILHVGGNQWYKNRAGVIQIYDAWRLLSQENTIPLLLIGEEPDAELKSIYEQSSFKKDIHFLSGKSDEWVRIAYAGATVFLFPSIAEGFGWPIAEAMASGIPVVTTGEAPMTEVAGNAAFLIKRKPIQGFIEWAEESALILDQAIHLSHDDRLHQIEIGLQNVERFNSENVLDNIERIYKNIIKEK